MNKELQIDALKAIALLVMLTVLNLLLPIFSFIIYLIWPIPVVYFIIKYDIKESLIVIVISAVLNAILIGMTTGAMSGIVMGMYSIVGFGLIGFFFGSAIKERFSPFKTLIMTIVGVLISNLIIIFAAPYILGFNYQQLLNEISNYINSNPVLTEYSLPVNQYIYFIKLLLPAIIVISAVVMGSLIYYITLWYLRRKEINIPGYKPVKYWAFPRWGLTFAILITLVTRTFLRYNAITTFPVTISVIISNLLVFLFFLLFLQGLAVVLYYLARLKYTFLNILLVLAFVFFNFLVFAVLALLGLIDLWFNLRKEETA